MNKKCLALVLLIVFMMILSTVLLAESGASESKGKSRTVETIFYTIVGICLLGGAFAGLPLIIYTNQAEKISFPGEGEVCLISGLTEEERNERARLILSEIDDKLHQYDDEDGTQVVTINSGGQAKFTKRGLDYINRRLAPTADDVTGRVKDLAGLYAERTKRFFTGSKWIIISGALFCVLALVMKAWGMAFVWILGLAFYSMASRMTIYGIEKMIEWKGTVKIGCATAIFSVLWSGMNTTYYNVYKDGRKEMDLHSTIGSGFIYFALMMFVVMLLVMLMPIIGALNFVLNYWSSLLLPFGYDEDKWYQENFA